MLVKFSALALCAILVSALELSTPEKVKANSVIAVGITLEQGDPTQIALELSKSVSGEHVILVDNVNVVPNQQLTVSIPSVTSGNYVLLAVSPPSNHDIEILYATSNSFEIV